MAHRTARLNESRMTAPRDPADRGWLDGADDRCRGQGVSRATGYKWVRRYRTEGLPGLADGSSRPHRMPRLSAQQAPGSRLRPLRGHRRRSQPASRRRPRRRRECRECCGRARDGSRHLRRREHRRRAGPHRHSSSAGRTARHAYCAALGDRRHSLTRPYRPQDNGKAERFIGTMVRKWAYARPYLSNAERLAALSAFVDFHNQRRPHTALGGLPPADVVSSVSADLS